MIKLYQEALSESIKAILNSEGQVNNYIKLLAECKVDNIAKKIVGKEFSTGALLDISLPNTKVYGDGPYKAIAVNYEFNYSLTPISIKQDYSTLIISVMFLRNPESILSSKCKLTDKERVILKRLKTYYSVTPGFNSRYSYSEVAKATDDLQELKNDIHVGIKLSWSYKWSKILSESFITSGIRAECSLI